MARMFRICSLFLLLSTCALGQGAPFAFWKAPPSGPTPPSHYYLPRFAGDSLVAQFMADSIGVAKSSGDTTYTWHDVSGNGHNVFQSTDAKKPIWYSAADSGHACMVFDGTDDYLNGALLAASQPNTMIICVKSYSPGPLGIYCDAGNFVEVGQLSGNFIGYAGASVTGPPVNIDSSYIIAMRFNGAKSDLRINGITKAGNAGTGAYSASFFYIGANHSPSAYASASIYEVILYQGLLTDSEMSQVETYLHNKWGVHLP